MNLPTPTAPVTSGSDGRPRAILPYPDPRLQEPAASVTTFDAALATLAADLVATLREAGALGITAPHVGVSLQVVVIRLDDREPARVYVNPRLVAASVETAIHEEGSVSLPGVTEKVERPARVRIAYAALDGTAHEEDAEGLLAVCHQHEIDQLAGVFWLERLSRLKRDRLLQRYRKRR